jgi:hypothetical protein
LNKLLRDIASLLQSDPDLFTNQLLEDLIPSVAEFISLSATLEDGTGSALDQRKDVLDNLAWALSLMQDLSDLPPVLQEQASHMRQTPTCIRSSADLRYNASWKLCENKSKQHRAQKCCQARFFPARQLRLNPRNLSFPQTHPIGSHPNA